MKISNTILERVKENPLSHARIMAGDEREKGGGTYGIFAYWQGAVKDVHRSKKSIKDAMNDLAKEYTARFEATPKNLEKEEKLMKVFNSYCKQYDKLGVEYLYSKKLVNWQLHDSVTLTGNTPWITKRGDEYVIIQVLEGAAGNWKNELRYPLIQKYLASYCLSCDVSNITMAVYSVKDNMFEIKNFSKKEIEAAITETKYLFTVVYNEYLRVKI